MSTRKADNRGGGFTVRGTWRMMSAKGPLIKSGSAVFSIVCRPLMKAKISTKALRLCPSMLAKAFKLIIDAPVNKACEFVAVISALRPLRAAVWCVEPRRWKCWAREECTCARWFATKARTECIRKRYFKASWGIP